MTTVLDRRQPRRHPAVASLPECATCPGHCCKNDTIILHPEFGDVVSTYDTEATTHPMTGELAHMLKHKPNGDCIYFGEVGGVGRCTVYQRRPAICRSFDCGLSYAKLPREERRRLVRAGLASKAVFDQGRRVQERRARETGALGRSPRPL
jgi:Fe-S-cluster containining protein